MKKKSASFFLIFFVLFIKVSVAQTAHKVNIIPKPQYIQMGNGQFEFSPGTKIYSSKTALSVASGFAQFLRKATGYKFPTIVTEVTMNAKGVYFKTDATFKDTCKGAYTINISTNTITVTALNVEGLFNATQSIRQLLPPTIESDKVIKKTSWKVPVVVIKDTPRFNWRGYMQDVSRTFYSVDVMKKYIDVMALYKLNILHFHLTDDQGWRIEIKKHPELTSAKTTVFESRHNQPAERSGFYTQAQIKDLINYAAARNITIIPEIDVPGHCWPIIITHPELGVNKKNKPDYVFPFLASWGYWGYQFTPNPLDPTNEAVYTFLDDIFTEVATLFPSQYIHFGGDEVVHRLWENEPHVKEFMAKKGMKTIAELQSYFVSRVSDIIIKNGKKPIGWNDILAGAETLPKTTTIMSWLGEEAIKTAAEKGFYTIATPTDPLYFDITQDDRNDGTMADLAYDNINSINKVYNFDPTAGLKEDEKKYVLGVQANMWPAIPQEVKDMNVQNFPRLLAVAEVGWESGKEKDFEEFKSRLLHQYTRLNVLKIDYFRQGGYITGTWKPDQIDTAFKPLVWNVNKKVYANGRIIAGFFFTGGKSFLKVKNVQLLENGKVVSNDNHEGLANEYRGTSKTKTYLYNLKLKDYKPRAIYTLRADVAGNTGNDSKGNVTFNLSPFKAFSAVEKK